MANPAKPDIDYSYSGFQQNNQDFPFPGTPLDNDLAELKRSISDTIDALADVRRSDGALKNGSVTVDSLSAEVNILAGQSAYAIAVANGFVGTEQEWLDSLEGQSATITIGSVSTGAPGSSAAVSNVGTSQAAVFNFSIPRGDPGEVTGGMVGSNNLSEIESASTARTNLGLGSLATASSVNDANWSGTDLAVANGGTGGSDAASARANLGLVIGTDIQAFSTHLAAVASLDKTDGGFIVTDGSTFVVESGSTARTSLGLGTSAVKNTGTSGDAVPLLNAANTWSGNQTVAPASGAASVTLNKAASGSNSQVVGRTNGVLRWTASFGNSASEAGANAGSDFSLGAYDDSGNLLGSAITATRSTQVVTIPKGGTFGSTSSDAVTFMGTAWTPFSAGLGAGADAAAWRTALGVSSGSGDMVGSNNLSDVASAATSRTNLGLGSLATASTVNNDVWSGADLAVTNGGTGASDASGARTNLGLVIGTHVQAQNANLSTLAAVTPGSTGLALLDDTSQAAARTTLGLGSSAVAPLLDQDDFSSNSATSVPSQQSVKAYVDYGTTWRSTRADAIANYHPATAPAFIATAGHTTVAGGGGAIYKYVVSEPSHPGKLSITLAPSGTAWYELIGDQTGRVTPEMFGATRGKGTLSTTALTDMTTFVNATGLPIRLDYFYRTAATMTFTVDGVEIVGKTGNTTGICFAGCIGFNFDHDGLSTFSRIKIQNVGILTDSQQLYRAIDGIGAASTGGAKSYREISGCLFAGEGLFDAGEVISGSDPLSTRAGGWLDAIRLEEMDNVHIHDNRIFGAWQQWQNNNPVSAIKFGIDSAGIRLIGCTGATVERNKAFYVRHGAHISGQCEGVHVLHNIFFPVWNGVTFEDITAPSNLHKIIGNHCNAFNRGVAFCEDQTGHGSTMNRIIDNGIFMYPGNNYNTDFRHIVVSCARSQIKDNYIYVAAGDVAATYCPTAIEVQSAQNMVCFNQFEGINVCLTFGVNGDNSLIMGNETMVSEGVGSVDPVVDAGSGNTYIGNFGDKAADWPT